MTVNIFSLCFSMYLIHKVKNFIRRNLHLKYEFSAHLSHFVVASFECLH